VLDDYSRNDDALDDDVELDTPYWTPQRILYTLVILITLIAFLLYIFSPLLTVIFNPPPSPPITVPSDRV
jgi:hypothetical protein